MCDREMSVLERDVCNREIIVLDKCLQSVLERCQY